MVIIEGQLYILIIFFIYLFDRDNAVKLIYRFAVDVMHVQSIASANFQL